MLVLKFSSRNSLSKYSSTMTNFVQPYAKRAPRLPKTGREIQIQIGKKNVFLTVCFILISINLQRKMPTSNENISYKVVKPQLT
jgi:hypothetical protein